MEQLTPEQEEFKAFCVEQSQRLGVFRDYGFMEAPARRDYRRWLEKRCATREDVQRVMDAAVELESIPTIADLNRLFENTCKPQSTAKEANPKCPLCAGTGWKLITRRGDEYVDRCCGAPPAFDPTKPPKTPTASLSEIEQLRQDNQRFAAELARDLAGKTSKPAKIPTATEEDITAILAEQARNRKHPAGCGCEKCQPKAVAK